MAVNPAPDAKASRTMPDRRLTTIRRLGMASIYEGVEFPSGPRLVAEEEAPENPGLKR
jgi:hypothetical protein